MCNCNGELVDHLLLQCPNCYRIMIYGVGFIWSLLGDAEDCCSVVSLLTRSLSPSLEWSFVDGCPTLLNVVYMEGDKQSEF